MLSNLIADKTISITIAWDGNIEGHETFADGSFVKISDLTPAPSELVGATVIAPALGYDLTLTEEDCWIIYGQSYMILSNYIVALEPNLDLGAGHTFGTPGVYVLVSDGPVTITYSVRNTIVEGLITDRTAADVIRWQTLRNKGFANMTAAERAEWLGGMKGAYNAADLNRVGTALNYLRDRILTAGYPVSFSAKTNWAASDVPTAAQFQYYLECVAQVREAISRFRSTPPVPAFGALDYQEANNIEKILIDIDTILNNLAAALFYSNDLYSGEV